MSVVNNKIKIAVRKFGPFEAAMEKLWSAFCAQTGCRLEAELVAMDLHPLYQTTIAEKGLQNGEWDIAHLNTDWILEAYKSRALLDLRPFIDKNPPENYPDGWSNSLLQMQQFGEEITGLPFHDGPECFIYRKDLFEDSAEKEAYYQQFGKILEIPQTWEEFRQVARFFNRPEKGLYGSVFACYPDGHNTVFDFCLQLWTRGGSLLDNSGEINIYTTEAIEGLEFYRQLVNDYSAVHPKSFQYESVQAGMAFARGEVAMMINWFGFASMCEVYEESKVKAKVDIAYLPHTEGDKSASLNVYWLYTIGAGSQFKDIAYDFIRFAIGPENDKLLTLEGGIGCRISTWQDKEINNIIPYYHKLEQLHQYAKSLPQKVAWAKIAGVIDQAVLKAIHTAQPVDDILRAAQEMIKKT